MVSSRFLGRIIKVSLVAALATPLIFGTYLLFPFVVYRTYFFYAVIDILAVMFVARYGIAWVKTIRDPLVCAFSLFIAIKLITDFFAPHFSLSFWGNYERMMGEITLIHVWMYVVMFITVFRTNAEYHVVLKTTVAVGTLVALYGLLQKFQIAFRVADVDPRLFSTIGNPAFLAGFLVITLFFAVYLIGTERGRLRYAYAVAIILITGALYLTATRGALIGVFVGFLVLLVYGIIYGKRSATTVKKVNIRQVSSILLVIILAIPIILWGAKDSVFVRSNLTLRRLADISTHDFSSNSRLVLWKMTAAASQDHFLIGNGLHNIPAALDAHYDPGLRDQWFDSSHNIFIDILLAHGLLGFLIYGALLVTLVYYVWRIRLKSPFLSACCLATVVAYVIQGLFIFDTVSVLISFALLIGLTTIAAREHESAADSGVLTGQWIVLPVVVVVCAVFIMYYRAIRVDYFLTRAYRTLHNFGTTTAVIDDLDRVRDQAFFGYENSASVARDMAVFTTDHRDRYATDDVKRIMQKTAEMYAIARDRGGVDSRILIDEAKVYLNWKEKDNPYLDDALSLINQAIVVSPYHLDVYRAQAEVYYEKGDIERMLGTLHSVNISLSLSEYAILAQHAVERQRWVVAEKLYQEILSQDPHDVKALSNLAQVYKAEGDREQARKTAEHLRDVDPNLAPEVLRFINSLF